MNYKYTIKGNGLTTDGSDTFEHNGEVQAKDLGQAAFKLDCLLDQMSALCKENLRITSIIEV